MYLTENLFYLDTEAMFCVTIAAVVDIHSNVRWQNAKCIILFNSWLLECEMCSREKFSRTLKGKQKNLRQHHPL